MFKIQIQPLAKAHVATATYKRALHSSVGLRLRTTLAHAILARNTFIF